MAFIFKDECLYFKNSRQWNFTSRTDSYYSYCLTTLLYTASSPPTPTSDWLPRRQKRTGSLWALCIFFFIQVFYSFIFFPVDVNLVFLLPCIDTNSQNRGEIAKNIIIMLIYSGLGTSRLSLDMTNPILLKMYFQYSISIQVVFFPP